MLSRLATRRAGCAKKPARRRWNLDVAHVPFSLVGSFMYHGRGLHGWRRRCAHTPRVETRLFERRQTILDLLDPTVHRSRYKAVCRETTYG